MNKPLSVAIVGAGPAGLSAALWCKNLGMAPVVIEREARTGGMQNFNFLENDWVLGLQDMSGVDIAQQFDRHVQAKEIEMFMKGNLRSITPQQGQFLLDVDGSELTTRAIIVATGTRYVGSEIFSSTTGFADIDAGIVVEGPYAFCDLEQCNSLHIGIVGGGDNAFENAMILLGQGCRVSMICRSQPRAQKKFSEPVLSHPKFTLYKEDVVKQCVVHTPGTCQLLLDSGELLLIDRLHILAGYKANSECIIEQCLDGLGKTLACDQQGFLKVDSRQRTNIAGIYAAGDIHNTVFPNVVSAIASGALAAKTISRDFSLA